VLKPDKGSTFIIQRLDGRHDFYQIYLEYVDRFGLVSPERISQIFLALEKGDMLAGCEDEDLSPDRVRRLRRGLRALLSPVHSIPHSDRLMSHLYRRLSFLFHPVTGLLLLGFGLLGFIPLVKEVDAVQDVLVEPSLGLYHYSWHLAALYGIILIMTAMHELAHGLTCKHFGGNVPRVGLVLLSGMFVFFCDTTSSWILPQKRKRFTVALAGPFMNLLCMSACFWVRYLTQEYTSQEDSFWFLAGFAALLLCIVNFIPLIRRIPNL
jgi:putative peptide zinc metalloprotease protein